MELLRDPGLMRQRAMELRQSGVRLGLVPTMGALHAGHGSLFRLARSACDRVVVSIFVNPLQFEPGEDLERYPRDLERDLSILESQGCDLVFAPESMDFYPEGSRTRVEVLELGNVLCGRTRPRHFVGVTTVVAKLFNLVFPHLAVFGQKDAQQAVLIRRMVRDLDWPLELRFAPIVRDPDGLALSSRNAYLGVQERPEALLLYKALGKARALAEAGERRASTLVDTARRVLEGGRLVRVDYVELVDTKELRPLDTLEGQVLLAVAAFVGRSRLIDNLVLEVDGDRVLETGLRENT